MARDVDPAGPQPPPISNDNPPIVNYVMMDLFHRAVTGKAKYGTYLQAGNGRDALIDAYQEALDLCMYLRQRIEEDRTNNTEGPDGYKG